MLYMEVGEKDMEVQEETIPNPKWWNTFHIISVVNKSFAAQIV